MCCLSYTAFVTHFDKKDRDRLKHKEPAIVFNEHDLSSASSLGRKTLDELNSICEERLGMSAQSVIIKTPKCKLIAKPTSQERQAEKRKTVRQAKKVIQQSMDSTTINTVMGNRISWRKFDKLRISEAMEGTANSQKTPTRKRLTDLTDENSTPSRPKRRHGSSTILPKAAEEELLTEARSWSADKIVNWSSVARRYGLTKANAGQSVKEFLRNHGIPAASVEQRIGHSLRRKRKVLPGGIPFPMQRPSAFHKKDLPENIGVLIVPTSVPSFRYSKANNEVVDVTSTVHARKIPLLDIRRKLLEKHEQLGVIRSGNHGTSRAGSTTATRHLKIWHDHS